MKITKNQLRKLIKENINEQVTTRRNVGLAQVVNRSGGRSYKDYHLFKDNKTILRTNDKNELYKYLNDLNVNEVDLSTNVVEHLMTYEVIDWMNRNMNVGRGGDNIQDELNERENNSDPRTGFAIVHYPKDYDPFWTVFIKGSNDETILTPEQAYEKVNSFKDKGIMYTEFGIARQHPNTKVRDLEGYFL